MMKKKQLVSFIMAFMVGSIFMVGCGAGNHLAREDKITQEPDNYDNDAEQTTEVPDNYDNEAEQITEVPDNYYNEARHQGTLEKFSYQTTGYDGQHDIYTSSAMVYLPYGYDENDTETKYNILYLQHGAYGNETTWMSEYGDDFKNMIDHMIEDKCISPLIIVMPYLPAGNEWYQDTTPYFYMNEIQNDLMPAVESTYHTYAENVTEEGFQASREHRIFGGFSAGGTTTWTVFLHGLDRFQYFMPMSGGLTLGGNGNSSDADAQILAEAVHEAGYDAADYKIFAATGTRDVAYNGLSAQIDSMKKISDVFQYTDQGFSQGNLIYYVVQGNVHDYPYTYEYVYNGLRAFGL